MVDHITYQVSKYVLEHSDLPAFMATIGFVELDNPALRDTKEHGWDVRWFAKPRKTALPGTPDEPQRPTIHLVAGTDPIPLGLGHFCVRVGADRYEQARSSNWCTRDSGSGRIWLEFGLLRVEVRP